MTETLLLTGEFNEKSLKRLPELSAECFRAAWMFAILHYGYEACLWLYVLHFLHKFISENSEKYLAYV